MVREAKCSMAGVAAAPRLSVCVLRANNSSPLIFKYAKSSGGGEKERTSSGEAIEERDRAGKSKVSFLARTFYARYILPC